MNPLQTFLQDSIRTEARKVLLDMHDIAQAYKGDKTALEAKVEAIRLLLEAYDQMRLSWFEMSAKLNMEEIRHALLKKEYLDLRRDYATLQAISESGAPKMTAEQLEQLIQATK